jgi:preprotein translocase subunit SecG
MQSLALVVHVALAVGVIGLVLIQHGKGAEAGAAFGSGASSTVFGARGSASFLTRLTTGLATAFFITSLFLFYLAAHRDGGIASVTSNIPVSEESAPAVESDLPTPVNTDGTPAVPAGSESDLPSAPAPKAE